MSISRCLTRLLWTAASWQSFLNISDSQLEFVTNSDPGQGLIYNGNVIVPFVNKLPKDTKEYQAMTTKPDEVKIREKLRMEAKPALKANAEAEKTGAATD